MTILNHIERSVTAWYQQLVAQYLTPITSGAMMPQVSVQYLLGFQPVICSMQAANLVVPKIQPMAMVWKKQHHKMGMPLAL